MCKNPKFSIVVPVYNVEPYLCFCLDSLVNQTLKDIEIICVNDGSTDSSLKTLEEYAKRDDRIQIVDKYNGGLSSARNVGLDLAEGEYVLFVDSDDYLEPNACERLFTEILQTNTDVIVFGTKIFPWRTREDQGWLYDVLSVRQILYEGDCCKALFREKASKPFVWNECYKRKVIEDNHIRFDESVRYGEDMIFLFTLFPRIKSVVYLPDLLYAYRCERDNSLMDAARKNFEWKMDMHLRIVDKILEDWSTNHFLKANMEELFYWAACFVLGEISCQSVTIEQERVIVRNFLDIINKYELKFETKEKRYKKISKYIAKFNK